MSASAAPQTPVPPNKLDVFYIRSDWRTPLAAAIEENIPYVAEMLKEHRFYVLNDEQVANYLKLHHSLVSSVPILVVVDREAACAKAPGGFGFRICFGVVKSPDVAVSLLKWATELVLMARAEKIVKAVRRSGHRETVEGFVELLGEGTSHLVEFAVA